MSFEEELILVIADKLAIGIIILLATLWINAKLERLKDELSRLSKEHEIRFSELHQKHANVLAKLYSLLEDSFNAARLFEGFASVGKSENMRKHAVDTLKRCGRMQLYFNKNKLYLSEELASRIEDLISGFGEPAAVYYTYVDKPEELGDKSMESMKEWIGKRANIKQGMVLIEKEFRTTLGSEIQRDSRVPEERLNTRSSGR